jgi:hypothetical protein
MRRTLSPPVELTEEDIAAHDVAREELERIGGERHVYDPDEIARGAILLIVALVFAVPAAVAGGLAMRWSMASPSKPCRQKSGGKSSASSVADASA